MFDFLKYATIATHLQMRAKQLRENPPDTVEEYAALIEEIKSLSDQLLGQRKSPDFDTAALKAGRDADLAGYTGTDADLDKLPPLPTVSIYMQILDADPDDSALENKDEIFSAMVDGAKKFMAWGRIAARPNLNAPSPGGWEIHRRVTK